MLSFQVYENSFVRTIRGKQCELDENYQSLDIVLLHRGLTWNEFLIAFVYYYSKLKRFRWCNTQILYATMTLTSVFVHVLVVSLTWYFLPSIYSWLNTCIYQHNAMLTYTTLLCKITSLKHINAGIKSARSIDHKMASIHLLDIHCSKDCSPATVWGFITIFQ